MEQKLWAVRLKSVTYKIGSLVGSTLVGALVSDKFIGQLISLLQDHMGQTIWAAVIVLVIPEIVAHIRNEIVVGRMNKKFGANHGMIIDLI